jgi:hypothetical protein
VLLNDEYDRKESQRVVLQVGLEQAFERPSNWQCKACAPVATFAVCFYTPQFVLEPLLSPFVHVQLRLELVDIQSFK